MDKLGDFVAVDASYVTIDTAGAVRPSFIALSTVRKTPQMSNRSHHAAYLPFSSPALVAAPASDHRHFSVAVSFRHLLYVGLTMLVAEVSAIHATSYDSLPD